MNSGKPSTDAAGGAGATSADETTDAADEATGAADASDGAAPSSTSDPVFPDEDPASHSARTYQTTYFVWANYDVAGSDQTGASETTSPAFLAAMAKEAIGAPLTDFQKAQLVARGEMPALSLLGALDAQGAWVGLDDEEALPQAFRDLACMPYLEFAEKLE